MTILDIKNLSHEDLVEESIRLLQENFWLKKQVFGQKSEKSLYINPDQTELELGVEQKSLPEPIKTIKVPEHDRRISNKPTSEIPEDLPVISEETILPEVDTTRYYRRGNDSQTRKNSGKDRLAYHSQTEA